VQTRNHRPLLRLVDWDRAPLLTLYCESCEARASYRVEERRWLEERMLHQRQIIEAALVGLSKEMEAQRCVNESHPCW
jgi:hypothetical protein